MTTKKIAARLVELCREGRFENAQKELYAEDAVSIEQESSPAFVKETKGLPAIVEKGKLWESMISEMHSLTISDPLITGSRIALSIIFDVTMKERGRNLFEEIAVYKVENGKIVSEEFFN